MDQHGNPYAVDKIAAHPEALAALREGRSRLLTVHLMPQNLCNQRCAFCSYRLPDNKNSEAFDEGAHLRMEVIPGLLDDFVALGVQGVEVTGGGEPLAHPDIEKLLHEIARRPLQIGLVTNGTLGHRVQFEALGRSLSWVRVSIDSARPGTYAEMRRAPLQHFDRAWDTVEKLAWRRERFHKDFRLGVGFVLCNENTREVYEFVHRARDAGADNVRLSVTFSDDHLGFFKDHGRAFAALEEADRAVEDFDCETFRVINLMRERMEQVLEPHQDYGPCYTKDVLCVVEGTGKVYTCCTFTGSLRGCYGAIDQHPQGFRGLWEEYEDTRQAWDSRVECPVACLYRERNLRMIEIVENGQPAKWDGVHEEFI